MHYPSVKWTEVTAHRSKLQPNVMLSVRFLLTYCRASHPLNQRFAHLFEKQMSGFGGWKVDERRESSNLLSGSYENWDMAAEQQNDMDVFPVCPLGGVVVEQVWVEYCSSCLRRCCASHVLRSWWIQTPSVEVLLWVYLERALSPHLFVAVFYLLTDGFLCLSCHSVSAPAGGTAPTQTHLHLWGEKHLFRQRHSKRSHVGLKLPRSS